MMNNTLKAVLLTSMLPFAANAAQELTPWYVGGGLGINNYEPNCDEKTMKQCGEDEPYAWDVLGGYLFNDYFGIELGYRDLGRAEWTDYSNKLNDAGAKGITLGLVAFWPLFDKFSLSAEAGAMNYLLSNKKQWGSEYYSDSGIAPFVGVGLGYNITENLKLSAKYRRYENLDENEWNTLEMESNYYGLELTWRFGRYKSDPAPAPVAAVETDADNDGVADTQDQCPDTPSTHKVDAMGCTVYEYVDGKRDINLGHINFENNSDTITDEHHEDLEKLAKYMNENDKVVVHLAGHASNVGNPDYNMKLSERRAQAVAKLMVNQYGISADRVSAKGYGITQPVMEGNTPEAHRANRRIEAHITGPMKQAVLK
ncbi:OmpA family protein [Shewanella sp. Isolate11]|uniref:OmpA family protein n=1 Tax=Shewanella sp. Isolate11 TaxID=2908530 RepID=UPI001EFE743D|nr:OmpA family protein [Shewanella sp. Isolate11]MCG9695977.1 OmpA family protein [Shewanella sp. Isolate11]